MAPRRPRNGVPEIRLSLRAAFCLSVPLLVGLLTNQRLYSVLVAIGALWAITQDGLDEWSIRGPRIGEEALASALGMALGGFVMTSSPSATSFVLLLTLVALLGGIIEASRYPTPGTYLVVSTTLGAGLHLTGHVLGSALALGGGGLWVFLVAMLMDRRKRLANQRVFLSHAFGAIADALEAVGTTDLSTRRARALDTLDAAQDVVGSGAPRRGGEEGVALRQCLVAALRAGEFVSYFAGKDLKPDAAIVADLREIATSLRTGTGLETVTLLERSSAHLASMPNLNPSLARIFSVPDPHELPTLRRRTSTRAASRASIPWRERLRFGVALAIGVGVAAVISRSLHGSHTFWLPLSVVFILRPDLGPVIPRALARTAGTAIGVGIAALVTLGGNSYLSLILWSCLMAALAPWAQRRSHFYAVMTITPIVFLFLGIVESDKALFLPRVVDTALAAVIVLVLDLTVWSTAPSLRPARQVEAAKAASERYETEASLKDPLTRNILRRRALRSVADARGALTRARGEPISRRRIPPSANGDLDAMEAAIDASTVRLLDQH